jgi:choline kinase
MLSFMGRTLIERQVNLFYELGIREIVIVRGFCSNKINYPHVKYYYNRDFASTNMLASLFCAEKELETETIVSYADILFEKRVLKELIKTAGDVVVSVDTCWRKYWQMRYGRVNFDTESLSIDRHNRIFQLGREKPPLDEIDARYIGLIKFSVTGIQYLKETWRKYKDKFWNKPWQVSGRPLRQAYMTDMLQALIEEGYEVMAAKTKNGWLEFDTNEDYEKALKWQREGKLGFILGGA